MTLSLMQTRLIEIVRKRVSNGELTESGLARLIEISQSHMHNVLKGIRMLSIQSTDDILREMHLNAEDLFGSALDPSEALFRMVPMLLGELGSEMHCV